MAEEKMIRLSQAARQINVALSTLVSTLAIKGFKVENNPNSKITEEQFDMLIKEFKGSAQDKATSLTIKKTMEPVLETVPEKKLNDDTYFVPKTVLPKEPVVLKKEEPLVVENKTPESTFVTPKVPGLTVLGKIDLNPKKQEKVETKTNKTVELKTPDNKTVENKPVEGKTPEKKPVEPEISAKTTVIEKTEMPVVKEKPVEVPEVKAVETKVPTEKTPVEEKAPVSEALPTKETPVNETLDPVEVVKAKGETLKGLTVLGKIELPSKQKTTSGESEESKRKRKRKRLKVETKPATPIAGNTPNTNNRTSTPNTNNRPPTGNTGNRNGTGNKKNVPPVNTDKQIQEQIRQTLAKINPSRGGGNNRNTKKFRNNRNQEQRETADETQTMLLKVTEFISASDLATLMNVSVNEVISSCLSLGMFVSINQRLDAEAITVIASEFGYDVEFISAEDESDLELDEADADGSLIPRAPVVTIMGHVDHGKTSLLDYIRKAKVAAGEAGGITQHIGAYDVTTDDNRQVVFLDTPGHEAFTAMRARGAKMTDVVVIVVAADDNVMPQTKEAINHAQVAGVPIIIAINKIDKPGANAERIRTELADMNILVEDWGGKYQCQEVSAKTGQGISELLEKILLEADVLELTANPNKKAVGTVIEASLDKGRGYITNVLVQGGTMQVGDFILSGSHFGKVKAMMNSRGERLKKAGPSTPVQVLGLNGATQAGDKFNVLDDEREAKEIATRREQILREQSIRTRPHLTLEEIGRRKALGNFNELNIIVKGDVDGSVEALSDSLLKLSTPEVQIRVIHKGVGQVSESDVMLASVSDAIIIAFQVRPSLNARKIADQEKIEIRSYSIIYDAIDELKDAMEGMLAPTFEEVILSTIEVREVFKISKIGTIAGCYVLDGNVKRNHKIRVIRNGIVLHTGEISSLKRMKDDVTEVKFGFECGISVKGFNDIEIGDTIESFEMKEVKRTLTA
jgi:translation initiation factor IF-2